MTSWDHADFADDGAEVSEELQRYQVGLRGQVLRAWQQQRDELDQRWDGAASLNDYALRLRPDQARDLARELNTVAERWLAEHPPTEPVEDGELVGVFLDVLPLRRLAVVAGRRAVSAPRSVASATRCLGPSASLPWPASRPPCSPASPAVSYAAHGAGWPLLTAVSHSRVTAAHRSTTVSAVSLAMALGGIGGSLLLPLLAERTSTDTAFLILGRSCCSQRLCACICRWATLWTTDGVCLRAAVRSHEATSDNLESRLTAVEREVAQWRERQVLAASDAAAARTLAAGADRDVSEVRAELRAHTSALYALRETQLEQGHRPDGVDARLDDQHRVMTGGFATVQAGLTQIVGLLEREA